jgi:hypothetical protein
LDENGSVQVEEIMELSPIFWARYCSFSPILDPFFFFFLFLLFYF